MNTLLSLQTPSWALLPPLPIHSGSFRPSPCSGKPTYVLMPTLVPHLALMPQPRFSSFSNCRSYQTCVSCASPGQNLQAGLGHTQRDGRAGQSGAWGPGALSLAAHDVPSFKPKHPTCMMGHSTHVTLNGQRGWAMAVQLGWRGKAVTRQGWARECRRSTVWWVPTLALPHPS